MSTDDGAQPTTATNDAPTTETDATAQDAATATNSSETGADGTPAIKFDGDFDQERAARLIENLRADREAERQKREQAVKDAAEKAASEAQNELAQKLGRALGLVKDEDETPSVESLTTSLQERDRFIQERDEALATTRRENAVLRYAPKVNGDPDALLDSRGFTQKLAGIDPNASDYDSQVEALIKAEVTENSRYRATQVAPANSNGKPAGGVQSAPENTIESFRKAYARERGYAE